MFKNKINKYLNYQLNLEYYSSKLYLEMSFWCDIKNLENAKIFFKNSSNDELKHMNKLSKFLCDIDILPVINSNILLNKNFNSLQNIFKKAYINEKKITHNINYISDIALKYKNYKIFHFLSWYILKQIEEEKVLKTIINNLVFYNNKQKDILIFDNLFLSKYI
ncbi:MAG: ferritin-like domain-containing protein [Enterobacteriaceae bacterium PSpyr]|nr:MAG: ferritin-like domain-containing protein [Enterobacteriaceae bacterium PSpyr]